MSKEEVAFVVSFVFFSAICLIDFFTYISFYHKSDENVKVFSFSRRTIITQSLLFIACGGFSILLQDVLDYGYFEWLQDLFIVRYILLPVIMFSLIVFTIPFYAFILSKKMKAGK